MSGEPSQLFRLHRYRRWDGELNRGRLTWLAIVSAGVRYAMANPKIRHFFTMATGFVLVSGVLFYVLSALETLAGTPEARSFYEMMKWALGVDLSGVNRIGEFRPILWRSVFILMIKGQLVWAVLVVSAVGPGLIANDLRFRALPIYFSKPVTPRTYILGKWLTVAAFVAMVTMVPNLLSLILGTVITGGVGSLGETLSIAGELLVSGLMVCLFAGAVILALSSLISDHRYVTVAWLAICVLPTLGQTVINHTLKGATEGWLGCISLWDNMLALNMWLFDIQSAWEATSLPSDVFSNALGNNAKASYASLVMLAWTVLAVVVCRQRIVKFSRSAANV